jgi:PAS domain S-box-containing protein
MPNQPTHLILLTNDAQRVFEVERLVGTEFSVADCESLEEARAMAAERTPDLLLADLQVTDGAILEFLESIGELCPFPVVVIGPPGDESPADRVLEAGALEYVTASADELERLPRIVRRSLREWDLRCRYRQAEGALRASEQRLRTIVDSERECVKLLDADCTLLDMNPAGLEMIAADSLDQVKGLNTLDLLDPVYHNTFREGVAAVFGGATTVQEFEIIALDGGRHWMEQLPIWDPENSGKVKEMLAVPREITERKQADADRNVSEARYRTLVERMGDGLLQVDAEDFIRFVNPQVCEMFGYREAEMIGQHAATLLNREEDRAAWRSATGSVPRVFRKAMRCACEKKTGELLTVWISATPVTGSDDGPAGSMAIITDITERKRSELKLRESEALLDRVIRRIDDVLIVDDAAGRVTFANDKFFKIFGLVEQDLNSVRIEDYVAPEWRERQRGIHDRRLRGERVPDHFECECLRSDGSRIWLEVSVVLITEGERIVGTQSVFRDITGRKRVEENLRLAHERESVLAWLGRGLAEADTVNEASQAILKAADELIGWDASWIHLWNEEEQHFEDLTNYDLIDGERSQVAVNDVSLRGVLPMDRRVIEEGPQLVLRKPGEDGPPGLVPFGSRRPSLSLMFVPLRAGEQFVGILSVQSYQVQAYSKADLKLLRSLGEHSATALVHIQIRAALSASEERFRRVWEGTADGLRLTDEHGVIVAANEAFCRMMGRERNEVEGVCLSAFYAAPERDAIRASYRERFAQRSFPEHLKGRMRIWDDRAIWLEISSCFIESDPVRPLMLGVFRDVTGWEETQQTALRAQRLESIGTLAGGVAHDLNNALASILFSIEELWDAVPKEVELLDALEGGGKRAASMVRRLLTFARGVEGERLLIQPRHLVREMEKIIRASFPKNINLMIAIDGDLGVILGDSTQLHQVPLNLCVNARDAMPAGGDLTLGAKIVEVDATIASDFPDAQPGSYVVLDVVDSGAGSHARPGTGCSNLSLPPGNRPRIVHRARDCAKPWRLHPSRIVTGSGDDDRCLSAGECRPDRAGKTGGACQPVSRRWRDRPDCR